MLDIPQQPESNEKRRELFRGADGDASVVGRAVDADEPLVPGVAVSESEQVPPPMPPNLVDFIGTQAGALIKPNKIKEGTTNRPRHSNIYPIAAGIGAVLIIVAASAIYLIKQNRALRNEAVTPAAASAPAPVKGGNGMPKR